MAAFFYCMAFITQNSSEMAKSLSFTWMEGNRNPED